MTIRTHPMIISNIRNLPPALEIHRDLSLLTPACSSTSSTIRNFTGSSDFNIFFFFLFFSFFLLYNIVLVLPYINMHPPRVDMCSPAWTPLPPPSPCHPSGSSQTSIFSRVTVGTNYHHGFFWFVSLFCFFFSPLNT